MIGLFSDIPFCIKSLGSAYKIAFSPTLRQDSNTLANSQDNSDGQKCRIFIPGDFKTNVVLRSMVRYRTVRGLWISKTGQPIASSDANEEVILIESRFIPSVCNSPTFNVVYELILLRPTLQFYTPLSHQSMVAPR